MRTRLARVVLVVALLALLGGSGGANTAQQQRIPPRYATDDPAGESPLIGLDGWGNSYVTRFLRSQAPANRADRRARNISLVGALPLAPFNAGVHGDVAGYKNLAFIGKWRGPCPGSGVDIIDITNPAAPVKVADTLDYADTSMEDMKAIRIGTRDVLGIGLQDCGNDPTPGVGKAGLELYDITRPAQPQLLSFFDVSQFAPGIGGVHELDLVRTPTGRVLALLAVPGLEAATWTGTGTSKGDLLIVDITDPANPALVGEWGVLDEPSLGLPFYFGVQRGADARTLLHSARGNDVGTMAYLSYWDAGVIILDIRNPASPVFLGRTAYAGNDEGNAHSVHTARGGAVLVQADEDFSPFELEFKVTAPAAIAGTYPAAEGAFTKPIVELPTKEMAGDVVHVGRGCPPSTPGLPGGDPYLANPAGKIALIERGVCRFDNKVAWAQINGATGAIVYNSAAGGDGLILMGGDNPVTQGSPNVIGTTVTISGIFVGRSTGLAMVNQLNASQTVQASAKAKFNGWGYLRFFDVRNPANPVPLATFATPNTNSEAVALLGTWSAHNPEVRGNTVYASWYSDGVRVIDITQPGAPREIGFWTGAGAPAFAPPVNIWSVVPHGDLLLASDRNFGLFILRHTP